MQLLFSQLNASPFQLYENHLRGSIVIATAYRLTLMMVLFTLSRIAFFLYNQAYFTEVDLHHFFALLLGGLRFDLTAVLYTNLLFIAMQLLAYHWAYSPVYQKVSAGVFFSFNGLALLLNAVDIVYYPFTNRRMTASVSQEFSNENNLFSIFVETAISEWRVTLFLVATLAIMVIGYRKVDVRKPTSKVTWYSILGYSGVVAICTYLIIAGCRGGFRHSTRPITISNAAAYVNLAKETAIVLNTPFSIFRTLSNEDYQRHDYFSEKELPNIYSPLHFPDSTAAFKPQNVVVIILESFAKEYFGFFNHNLDHGTYQGYTPFLDSLLQQSLTFEHSFSNGRKSIDAMPSVLASMPSLQVPFVLSHYSNNDLKGLPSHLNDKGYRTAFFHGAPNGSMGFDAFANLAGFEEYYGMTEYGNDDHFDGIWGIWDHYFFDFMGKTLNTFEEPFMASVFSCSSHHPFKIPDGFEGKVIKGTLPIHPCVSYTDLALRQFFENAAKQPWFENTLFVITADHTNQSGYQEYKNDRGVYEVPLIFFHPKENWAENRNEIAQQIDIMPSVLDYLNYEKPYLAFGRSVFDATSVPFAFNHNNGVHQLFSGNKLIQYRDESGKIEKVYDFKKDIFLKSDLPKQNLEYEMDFIHAFLQQYNNRMLGNALVYE